MLDVLTLIAVCTGSFVAGWIISGVVLIRQLRKRHPEIDLSLI
jgi:hypothetical protein